MIKKKVSLCEDVGIQLEELKGNLVVAFYMDADYGVTPICKIPLKELSTNYINNNNNNMNILNSYLLDIINEGLKNKSNKEEEDTFPDSGFGDSFGELAF
tara:strand:+ start:326 stop:625 length:300 start_codon:yes stop_codon:yes gene_type:complete